MIDDYMMNARNNKPYDFKVTNGTNTPIEGIDIYRGMPIGKMVRDKLFYLSQRYRKHSSWIYCWCKWNVLGGIKNGV